MSEDRVWGRNPVLALLRSGARRADEVAILAGGRGPLAEVVALARRAGVKVSFRTRDQLTAIAGTTSHQGVVARVASADYSDLDQLLTVPAQRQEAAFFLALDQIQDPRNLGALLRTADAFGVHGVVVPKHHAVGLTEAAARTAMRRPTSRNSRDSTGARNSIMISRSSCTPATNVGLAPDEADRASTAESPPGVVAR